MTAPFTYEELVRNLVRQHVPRALAESRAAEIVAGRTRDGKVRCEEPPPRIPSASRGDPEHQEQVALFAWADLQLAKYPELYDMYAIPNWFGLGTKASGGKARAEGRKAGVPDVVLPVARYRYHGLYIEMKAPKGSATAAQLDWITRLRHRGYAARVCVGFESARETIETYLALPVPPVFEIEPLSPPTLARFA
jgi:hypothetical protein